MMRSSTVVAYMLLLAALVLVAAANDHKKIPFNGSMYGKRTVLVDYEAAAKALAAVCEVAADACSVWGSQPDK